MANLETKESGKLQEKQPLIRFLEVVTTSFKGVMVFGRGKEKKSFVFDAGTPYFPNALLTEGALGKTLFEKNLINAEQFGKIKELEATGKSFFEAATKVDATTKAAVEAVILDLWIEDLSTIFMWESGQFASVEFMPKDVTRVELPYPVRHYIFRALLNKNKKLKNKFAPTMRFEHNPETKNFNVDELHLGELESKVYASLKQSKQTRNIAPEVGVAESIVAPIVYSLREIGLVRADSDPRAKAMAIPTAQATSAALTSDEFTKTDELFFLAKLKEIETVDYFDLLAVKKDINNQDLQKVYFTMAKKFHPDRIKTKMNIQIKDAERFFAKVTEAYNTLSNPVLRKDYEFNNSKEAGQHEALMKKILDSETLFLDGRNFLNRNLINEAIAKIQEAIALYDKEPEYFITLGWALFRQGSRDKLPSKIAEGKKYLVDAYNREYQLALVSYYLGMISKHEGKVSDAIKFLKTCIATEPTHSLAMSELRFLEKKQDEKPGKKK